MCDRIVWPYAVRFVQFHFCSLRCRKHGVQVSVARPLVPVSLCFWCRCSRPASFRIDRDVHNHTVTSRTSALLVAGKLGLVPSPYTCYTMLIQQINAFDHVNVSILLCFCVLWLLSSPSSLCCCCSSIACNVILYKSVVCCIRLFLRSLCTSARSLVSVWSCLHGLAAFVLLVRSAFPNLGRRVWLKVFQNIIRFASNMLAEIFMRIAAHV